MSFSGPRFTSFPADLVCGTRTAARALTPRTRTPADSGLIAQECDGHSVALKSDVIWFFEKEADLLVCEIRRPADNQPGYEFEVASSSGPITHKFDTRRSSS